jgi:hypothetical protein
MLADARVSRRQELARAWFQHLGGVHDLIYDYEDKCSFLGDDVKKSTLVKVAVLDTGLQLSEELQENYIDAGRIDILNSHSFVTNTGESATEDWKVDGDQHGSRVGQIVLDVCPKAVLHVAKVFRSREDLANPAIAEQVHERISKVRSPQDKYHNDLLMDLGNRSCHQQMEGRHDSHVLRFR